MFLPGKKLGQVIPVSKCCGSMNEDVPRLSDQSCWNHQLLAGFGRSLFQLFDRHLSGPALGYFTAACWSYPSAWLPPAILSAIKGRCSAPA
jgi:hypothetical protein